MFQCIDVTVIGQSIVRRELPRYVKTWELFAKVGDLWEVVNHDIRLVGMQGSVVLMVVLSRIELIEGDDLSDDCSRKNFGLIELIDVGLSDPLLIRVGVKDD